MKEVNLNQILIENSIVRYDIIINGSQITAMKEACKQTVELCLSNLIDDIIINGSQITKSNKDSILNTINQIV